MPKKGRHLEDVYEYLEKYDLFINKVASNVKINCPRKDLADIKQDLILVLLTHFDSYDYSKNEDAKPYTYYSQIILNGGRHLIKEYYQYKNKIHTETVSLDSYMNPLDSETRYEEIVAENNIDYFNPSGYVVEKELAIKINEAFLQLTVLESKIINDYIDGESVDVISKRYGKSKKTIYNLISYIKEKIKKIVED